MSDVAYLEIKVDSDGVAQASGRLDELSRSGAKAERASSSLAREVAALATGFVSLAAAKALVSRIVDETAAFEKLRARLVGVTGSVENAEASFRKLQEISEDMVYGEGELAQAFLTMAQTGLDPSERSLRAMAELAAATGATMEGLTNTILQASMGVTRGLKQFGVNAKLEGDTMAVTFRGATEVIQNDALAIQQYMVRLAETKFAGSAARELDTVGGAITMLRRNWSDMLRDIGRGGLFGDAIRASVGLVTDAVNALSSALAGGGGLSVALAHAQMWMTDAIADFHGLAVAARFALDTVAAGFTDDTVGDAYRRFRSRLDEVRIARKSARADIVAMAQAVPSARPGSLEYEAPAHATPARTRVSSSRSTIRDEQDQWRREAEARQQAVRELSLSLATEEEKIRASYEKRTDIIVAGTADGSNERAKLAAQSRALYDKELEDLRDRLQSERDAIAEAKQREREDIAQLYATEEQQVEDNHQRRLEALRKALENEAITRREHAAARLSEEYRYSKELEDLEFERQKKATEYVARGTQNAEALFGSLTDVTKNFGGEQSGVYRAMFASQKAFATASAMVASGQAMAEAMKLGWPAGIAAGIAAAAQVAKAMSIIASANYSGAYDAGGFIPAGKWGIAGERGPEVVQGPAQVTSRAETAQMLGGSNLTVVVAPDPSGAEQFMMSASGDKAFLALARKHSTTIRRMVNG